MNAIFNLRISVAAKYTFSSAGYTTNNRINRLSSDNMEMIVCLNKNKWISHE